MKVDAFLLGVETPTGQLVLKRFRDHFPIFKVAAPTSLYPDSVEIPPYLIPVNLDDVDCMTSVFQSVDVVIACHWRYTTSKIMSAAKSAGCYFLNATMSYPEIVIESCWRKFSFRANSMVAYQSASGIGFSGFWKVSHRKKMIEFPKLRDNRWSIEQDPVSFEGITITHRIAFKSKFWAVLFWIWALILRFLVPFFGDGRLSGCECDWNFIGTTEEHGTMYCYEGDAMHVDSSILLPDLLVTRALSCLRVKDDECCDWPAFPRLNVRLNSFREPGSS